MPYTDSVIGKGLRDMESTARRAFRLLRQHFLLLSGPWLVVCAVGVIVTTTVQQILNRLYPLVYMRAAVYGKLDTTLSYSVRNGLIRAGSVEGVQIVEVAFKVIALALMVLLVEQLATQGGDTFSAALERLQKVPSVAGTLLKFFAIVLLLGLATSFVTALPIVLYTPLTLSMHMSHHLLPRWVFMVSNDLGRLLFVVCVMPFFLNLVSRLQRPSFSGEERPPGLLSRAMGYGALAVVAEVALGLLMRPMQRPLWGMPPISALIGQSLIGLATNLVTSLPTIACVVAIVLMVADVEEPVTDGEPA
jgi:hypothetical protein